MTTVTTAAAPMPAMQPYKQGSSAPTDATVTSPEKRWASESQVATAEKNPTVQGLSVG